MPTIYVREQGAVVRLRGERLVITKARQVLQEIPLIHVEQLVLMGRVEITAQAANSLLQKRIRVIYLSRGGSWKGQLVGRQVGDWYAERRLVQYRVLSDEGRALAIARAMVLGKLNNQRTLLQRQLDNAAGRDAATVLHQAIGGLAAAIQGATTTAAIEVLRGHEGRGAAFYFAAWRVLMPREMPFHERVFPDAKDPVNALLNFGYTQLTRQILAAVEMVGLDPYLGPFHAIAGGRPSLALDLVEEFRPILVDGMVLELIHRRQVTAEDFEIAATPKRPLYLNAPARSLVLRTYEARVDSEVSHHSEPGRKTTYRRCFELQAHHLYDVLSGQKAVYQPMLIR